MIESVDGKDIFADDSNDVQNEESKELKETKKDKKKADKKDGKLKKEIEELKNDIEKLKSDIDEQKNSRLRIMAEYDNFRRRAREEKEATYSEAFADAVKEILPIMDNLERAQAFTEGEKIIEGLQLTFKSFNATLEKLGVEEIECKPGDKFDPNLHNAVMHTEDENFGENEVAEVFQTGYKKGDRIIRYTMVKVAN